MSRAMSEPELEVQYDPSMLLLQPVLDLIASAGYSPDRNVNLSASDKLVAGLAWCIATAKAIVPELQALSGQDSILQDKIKTLDVIESALRSMGCPYPLQANQIRDLDYGGIYPVVQWIVSRVSPMQTETTCEEQHAIQLLEKELCLAENSIKMLHANLKEQNMKKENLLNAMQHLHERIDKEGGVNMVPKMVSLLKTSKDLERQALDFRSCCKQKHSDLQAEVTELETKINCDKSNDLLGDIDHSLCNSLEKLNLVKSELATKLRKTLVLKRQLDDRPSQTELIQYERRFSELYVQIQEKLRQTRKYYATYNALLEKKELMLKETSLLNSISSQFQDTINSTTGRVKLINSMEGIVKGTQQKLERVQLGLQAEQKVCDALKEKYTAAIAEQRHCSSLLKAFQEECARNERLRSQSSV
ncbi:PREDICTED: coiled-coil domain-containing protein 93 isoform X2 [Nelumbo nucifera]|uniref:Coiled-coil domain-containing protein 93 isoform X2 n=1 Tax=Nelumbo nucifera TaxID=4432 RepID=A0A1U7Z8Z4_NELNU|nr:PREDICTED: coiled-coil domain-containing protein 93 isoform X2 [Nelumbo nucifera]